MEHKMREIIDLTVELTAETERAVLVHTGDKSKSAWLPRSQIEIAPSDVGGLYVITLPEWLAIEKELV